MHHQKQNTSVKKMTTENNNVNMKITKIKKMTTIFKIITIVTTTHNKILINIKIKAKKKTWQKNTNHNH